MSQRVKIGPNDRLGMTLMLAGALHAIAVLGISFAPEVFDSPDVSMLDVILVQTKSEKAPEKADYLAQANQSGGGESDENLRPSDMFSSIVPKPDEGIAPLPLQAQAPAPQVHNEAAPDVILGRESENKLALSTAKREQQQQALPQGDQLIERDLEMARLQAEIRKTQQAYAKRPKLKYITANTQEYAYASYMQSWVARVERVGNINYPPEARERNLLGSLVLAVSIRRDGSVAKIDLIQSSGEPILDDAAMRIVELAGPYSAIPDVPGDAFDILHITRTWQFLPGNVLTSN
jgi:periplasmic protein TonB